MRSVFGWKACATYVVRVPRNITHTPPSTKGGPRTPSDLTSKRPSTTTISQRYDFTFSPQIPDDRIASAARAGEDVLDLLVPCKRCDFVEFGTFGTGSGGIRRSGVLQIPNIDLTGGSTPEHLVTPSKTYLAADSSGSKQIALNGVEVKAPYGPSVGGIPENQRRRTGNGQMRNEQKKA